MGALIGALAVSVVNAILLRSLPFRAPEEIVQVEPTHGIDTARGFHRWRTARPYLADAVSYDRAEMLQGMSRYGRAIILNRGMTGQVETEKAVKKFREAVCDQNNPVIMAGPSFTTGWDFSNDQLEVNIIMKVPWPDISDPVIKARTEDDEHYPLYVGMQEIVQAAGRGTRHETDRSETFILDAGFAYFYNRAKEHAPRSFVVWTVKDLPKAPPKMERVTV